MRTKDSVVRAAVCIQQRLCNVAGRTSNDLFRQIEQMRAYWQGLDDLLRRHRKAQDRGWNLAAQQVRREAIEQIRQMQEAANLALQAERRIGQAQETPSLGCIAAELLQLFAEFDEVDILPKPDLIVVQTEPIELEGLALGSFAIELHLDKLSQSPDVACFTCVALEPNPPTSNEDVTHPHVKNEELCAGDATVPIAKALRQGRINDAFCLVRSVLSTYNPTSPYVSIDGWDGRRCADCDCVTDSDYLQFCEDCEKDYCSDCISSCDVCHTGSCRQCLERDETSG